jgi:hypothetical protein
MPDDAEVFHKAISTYGNRVPTPQGRFAVEPVGVQPRPTAVLHVPTALQQYGTVQAEYLAHVAGDEVRNT